MKFLVFSDLHGDWTTGGLERFDELSAGLDQIYSYAASHDVDRVIFTGDLTDPDVNPALTHRTIAATVRLGVKLHAEGIAFDLLVGNHDIIEDGRRSHTLMSIAQAGFYVHVMPGNTIIHDRENWIEIVWLPYPGRAFRYDPDQYIRDLAESHRMGVACGTLIVCGHMTKVPGASVGSETIDMARGSDCTFPLEACNELKIAGRYDRMILINGHFHQRVVDGPVLIPGAMARLTHGEEHHQPGFLVFEV